MQINLWESIVGFFFASGSIFGGGSDSSAHNDYQQPPLSEREGQKVEIVAEPSFGMLNHVVSTPPGMVANYIIYSDDETVVYTTTYLECGPEQRVEIEGVVRRVETSPEDMKYYRNFHIDASFARCID